MAIEGFGVTDYDPATVTTVRRPIDGRVDKVLVDLGAKVHKDDPPLEISCAALAAAKNDYEVATAQRAHDKKKVEFIKAGFRDDQATPKMAREAENDEALSRAQVKVARDRLLANGLTEAEIADIKNQDGVQKARMTLRSRADGVLVKRDVVAGNYYDSRDTLLTIVPLDHLWVRGTVAEQDVENLELGQPLKVIFPFSSSNREIAGKLDFIDRAIDPDTRKARFRTTIPNPEGRNKSGSYVKVEVQVTPESRQAKGKETPGPSPREKGEGSKAKSN